MQRRNKLRNYPITKLPNRGGGSRGYVLITLMLMLTVMAIAALAVLPEVAQQMKRDREEEMIHRALQYSRSIRRFYKKFGRYPTKVEELESSNNIRFLRKRYKDPINGQDFKLLRVGDPQLVALGIGMGMGMPGQGMPGMPGSPRTGPGASNMPQQMAQQVAQMAQMGALAQPQNPVNLNPGSGDTENAGEGQANPNASGTTGSPTADSGSRPSPGSQPPFGSGQVFGGAPFLGVASASKQKTIREFNNKNHYNDWLFVYDPNSDRGGLLNTPYQPSQAQGFGAMPGQAGGGTPVPNAGPRSGGTPQPQGPPNPPDMPPDQ